MTTIQIETTYWNNKGAEQDKYNEMERAGWFDHLTKDSEAKKELTASMEVIRKTARTIIDAMHGKEVA